jgi:hypothetical protein
VTPFIALIKMNMVMPKADIEFLIDKSAFDAGLVTPKSDLRSTSKYHQL